MKKTFLVNYFMKPPGNLCLNVLKQNNIFKIFFNSYLLNNKDI